MYNVVLVRYGEIGLKGRNRPTFEGKLLESVRRAVGDRSGLVVHKEYGRVILTLPHSAAPDDEMLRATLQRVAAIFGVVSISPAIRLSLDFEEVKGSAVELLRSTLALEAKRPRTFKIQTRRPNKRFPYRTPEINTEVGAHVLAAGLNLEVDVHAPDITLFIEVRDQAVYMYSRSYAGPGGLPVGSSSRALLLLSGGIDSPVAGWFAMKRGIRLDAVHFHSPPFTSERAKEKVLDLAGILSRFAGRPIPVHVVGFTPIQQAIRAGAPEAMGITLMRRMMLRIAAGLAERLEIPALVTGESVGQVASQTLESMQTINAVTAMPVLRPLVAMDKSEIVTHSQRIGTYETSIQPYDDCCTLFVPRHPETKPRLGPAQRAEEALDVDGLVDEALASVERLVREVSGPGRPAYPSNGAGPGLSSVEAR